MIKILVLILLLTGGVITFASSKIIDRFFKSDDENKNLVNGVKVKGIGLALVLLATVLMYFFA